ncbi:MAG: dynamin family protein [bacterium]|nr:dynamin family protein [bacterium]
MALVKKNTHSSSKQSSTPKKQVIKVNPYENPENVLELMSQICSAKTSVNTDAFWNVVRDAYHKEMKGTSLCDYLDQCRGNLWDPDFEHKLNDYCRNISWSLTERQNTEDTQIVVAGGFSSGKSSFLNQITKCAGLLPTGTEPVSVVKTYLYCSKYTNNVRVRGVNQKNVLVDLNTGVLQAIQHANKSNIYLASVLDMLFVQVPSVKLNGLVFIDTPGYNNSDKVNDSNGKTDRETAIQALQEGNVLFWFVGSDRPTITVDDLDVIKQFDGKKVILFNKADKHGYKESVKIVEDGARIIYNNFPREEIIDIIAYSTLEDKIYYSKNRLTMEQIIDQAKRSGTGKSKIENLIASVSELFETEIQVSINTLKGTSDSKGLEADLQAEVDAKQELYSLWQDNKDTNTSFLKRIKDIMVDSYTTVFNAANTNYDFANYAFSNWLDFHNGVLDFDKNDHWGNSSILDRAINESARAFNAKNKAFYNFNWNYYNEDYRKEHYKSIESELNSLNDFYKDWYDDHLKKCKDLQNKIQIEKDLQDRMRTYKGMFMPAVEMGIKLYQTQNRATDVQNNEHEVPNVFDCIQKGDYKRFLRSFEGGVDLSVCNADGYNPLTLAVQTGNNMMVQFMLDHLADPAIKDRRGYNAFHTAVENQYRDICKMLLDVDPDLINTKTSAGISIAALAKKQTFMKWIEQEIDNAL